MCYGENCGREGAFGTCAHPEDCILRAIERDEEENLAVQRARDEAMSRETFLCPNCLGEGERHELTYAGGLFTCPECGAVSDAEELVGVYEYVRSRIAADPRIDASIATLTRGRAA